MIRLSGLPRSGWHATALRGPLPTAGAGVMLNLKAVQVLLRAERGHDDGRNHFRPRGEPHGPNHFPGSVHLLCFW